MGNRFFANGTGLAYFNDSAVFQFNQAITPSYGFYYDDSTIFYGGDFPGVTANKTNTSGSVNRNINNTMNDAAIPRGIGAESRNLTLQPDVLRITVGDIVRWINEDWNSHSLNSPPYVSGGSNVTVSDLHLILDGMNFETRSIAPGKTVSIQFTKPGGFHYTEMFGSNVVGTVIVDKG
jgi:plastocyanin